MTPADTDRAIDDQADQEDGSGSGLPLESNAEPSAADRVIREVKEDTVDEDGSPTFTSVDGEDATPTVTSVDDEGVEDTGATEEDEPIIYVLQTGKPSIAKK